MDLSLLPHITPLPDHPSVEATTRPRRYGLKARMSLGVAAVVMAATLTIATVALQLVKNRMQASISAEEMASVTNIAEAIDEKFASRRTLLQTFGDSIETQGFKDATQIQPFLEKHPPLKQAFDNVAVIDLNGNLVANLNGSQQIGAVNLKDRDYFLRTIATKVGVVSQPYRNRINGLAQVAITEPLFDSTGQVRFVMSGAVNLQDRNILGSLADVKFGHSGYLFIATTDGTVVDHPLTARILHNVGEYGSDKAETRLVSTGFEGSTYGIDETGRPALFAFKHIRQTDWVVGAMYPQDEAFASIKAIERGTWIGALILGLAAGALALVVVRRQLNPLGELHEHMRFAQSRPAGLEGPARPRSYANDEIGDLSRTFDQLITERRRVEQSLAHSEAQVRTIADNIPALVSHVDASLHYTFTNAHVRGVLQGDALVGKSMPDARGAADFALVEPYYRRALAGETCIVEKAGDAARGHGDRTFKAHYIPDIDAQGVVRGVFAMTFDVTEEVNMRRALAQQERRLRDVTDNMPALVGYFDRELNCHYGNSRARQMAQLGDGPMIGVTLRSSLGDSVYEQIAPHLPEVMAGKPVHFPVRAPLRDKQGHFQVNIVPDCNVQGEVLGFYLMSFNITTRMETELRLAESELRLRSISDNMPALITYIDRSENITFINAASGDWFGQTPSKILGRHFRDVAGTEVYEQRKPMLARALAGERVEFETSTQSPGHDRVTQVIYVPDTRADGVTHGIFSLALDITRLKVVERQLFELARIDTLTGLPNRLAFNEYLPAAVARARQDGASIALMFLDVDRFKAINDTLGHAHGDAVLVEYARRLQANVRGTDMVARLAGDEFVLVMEDIGSPDAIATVAAKIVEQINAPPFMVEGAHIEVSTSIGIAYQRARDAAISAAELLARADAALYNAKAAGRNRYAFFFPDGPGVGGIVEVNRDSRSGELPR
ncbi:PAS domain-containing protein [Variovorax sp. H27-G14]|uniref:sensor domain-containing diguanylate cyclase n=1 Tax=Variovorax sp. H27-G14 TaxID=3111914 RepID=UPI0038FC6491